MTSEKLELILSQHGIHPKFWGEIKALVFQGTPTTAELQTRLNYVSNYKTALDTILAELSKQVPFKFPPPPHCKSLEVPA